MREEVTQDAARIGVDILWIPLGAGTGVGPRVVRFSGRTFEALSATAERRPRQPLYHSALEVRLPEGRSVIEVTPIPRANGVDRGVVGEGAVGSRWLGRLRVFRYEVRRWQDGTIPDAAEATDIRRVVEDPESARRIVALVPSVPTAVWGRDELGAGDMWNSNSVIAWLLVRAGIDPDGFGPPDGGRAPGWASGIVVARRDGDRPTPAVGSGPGDS